MNTLKIGFSGEKASCNFLKKKGYKILKRNYKKTYGEIDIIAQKGDTISFVEVKTRANTGFGLACEAVTKSKRDKIIKTAYSYIKEHNPDADFSFDIIEVYHEKGTILKIEHLENAF